MYFFFFSLNHTYTICLLFLWRINKRWKRKSGCL